MYHRQVSSSPRSVPATRSSTDPVPPSTSSTRLSIAGVTGSPVSVGGVPGLAQRGQLAVADPVGRRERQAVVEDRRRRPTTPTATTNGAHSSPAYAGSEQSVTSGRASRSPTRVPPPRRLKTDWPVVRRRARRPTSRRRSSGRPPRSAAGSCRSGPAGRSTVRARPAEPPGELAVDGERRRRRRSRGSRRPTQALLVRSRGLAGALEVAGRLDVPEPQPGRGAEVRRGHLVLGEAEEHRGRRHRARPNASPSAGANVVEDVRCRSRPARRPSRGVGARRRPGRSRRSAGRRRRAAASAAATRSSTSVGVVRAAGHRRRRDDAAGLPGEGDRR